MMVDTTTLTLRVTLRMAAINAHDPPTVIATTNTNGTCSSGGRLTSAPAQPATSAARMYWPFEPMLNRFILNPIATATPEMYSGTEVLMMSTTAAVESIVFHISTKASTGLLPEISSAIDEIRIAAIAATRGASDARQIRSNISELPPFAPVMYDPSSAGVTVFGSTSATISPRNITSSRSDRPISSSRSADTRIGSETCGTGVAQDVPDHRLGADVDTASGMCGDQYLGLGGHLASDDQLLLVATRQGERRHVDARGAHVELVDDGVRSGLGTGDVEPRTLGERPPMVVAERGVLPQREPEDEAVLLTVLGDVADAGVAAFAGGEVGDVVAVEAHGTRRRQQTDERAHQLALSVPLHAGDTDDLSSMHRETDLVDRVAAAVTR